MNGFLGQRTLETERDPHETTLGFELLDPKIRVEFAERLRGFDGSREMADVEIDLGPGIHDVSVRTLEYAAHQVIH
ncbi:hypothetical protein [Allorhizobium borbori]|uniref:hypothetical protein n=1 Tax=Allorhizobium borbori TaxID=485907 RepID=UPI00161C57D8|nr:hypothetical protein [Allorhizobium borbori]